MVSYAGSMPTLIEQGDAIKAAAPAVAAASNASRVAVLRDVAQALRANEDALLAANARDLDAYVDQGAGRDRLTLTSARIAGMAQALEEIADQPDPLGEILDADAVSYTHLTLPTILRV